MRPNNVLEGAEQADRFVTALEKLAEEAKIGELSVKEVVETLGLDLYELVSLEALIILTRHQEGLEKLLSIGLILGVLYGKKTQENQQTAVTAG